MKKLILLFAVALIFYSCNESNAPTKNKEKENVDGGSCDFVTQYYPYILSEIEIYENGTVNLYSYIECTNRKDTSLYCDTINFNEINRDYSAPLDTNDIKQHNLKIGDTIYMVSRYARSGGCGDEPEYMTIEMDE